jgi:putative DNA primase/helicase
MFTSKHGKKIEALYNGDTSAHSNDDSAADAALCEHLAFWTSGNASRVTSLWLESPLGARNKTQSRKDYQERTVNFAIKKYTATTGTSLHPVGIGKDNQNQTPQIAQSPFIVISGPELLAMDSTS